LHYFAGLTMPTLLPILVPVSAVGISIEMRRRMPHDLDAAAFRVDVSPGIAGIRHSRDPGDDPYIHAALAAPARWLVTGDQDLLVVAPAPAGPSILTPAAALQHPDFLRPSAWQAASPG
jgi:predicted nucleic acid-binding protein